eukprot:scaffold114577_cov63-Phaeocystis_antarctica.AAC.2
MRQHARRRAVRPAELPCAHERELQRVQWLCVRHVTAEAPLHRRRQLAHPPAPRRYLDLPHSREIFKQRRPMAHQDLRVDNDGRAVELGHVAEQEAIEEAHILHRAVDGQDGYAAVHPAVIKTPPRRRVAWRL